MRLYDRRLRGEWELLDQLRRCNPGLLTAASRSADCLVEDIRFVLSGTPATMRDESGVRIETSHRLRIRYPRFFPAVPLEAYVPQGIFHPNVDPQSGFICLWSSHSPSNSIIHAILILRQVLSWHLMNDGASHLMQADALAWFRSEARHLSVPFAIDPLILPSGCDGIAAHVEPWHSRSRRRFDSG